MIKVFVDGISVFEVIVYIILIVFNVIGLVLY